MDLFIVSIFIFLFLKKCMFRQIKILGIEKDAEKYIE